MLKSRMWQGNKCRCLGARHLQQVQRISLKARWEFLSRRPRGTRHLILQELVLGLCRGLPTVPMTSFNARSICSCSWEKSWDAEQSHPLSAILKVQKTHYRVLSAAARQEVREVTSPGSQQIVQKLVFSYQLIVCKQRKTESFRSRKAESPVAFGRGKIKH